MLITAIHPLDNDSKFDVVAFPNGTRPLTTKMFALDTECDVIIDTHGIVIINGEDQYDRKWNALGGAPDHTKALAWAMPVLMNLAHYSGAKGTIDLPSIYAEGFSKTEQFKV